MTQIEIFADAAELANAAGDFIVEAARSAVEQRGRFNIALSGGSTPKATYTRLASNSMAGKMAWDRTHIFWGDERCVPPYHPDSNYHMVRQSLLDHIPIPLQNVHRIKGEADPKEAAREYEAKLSSFFPSELISSGLPSFDLVLLGMGEDGHTASLFPGSPALQVADSWVAIVEHDQGLPPLVRRITLTLPAINAAGQVVFLVSGAAKAACLKQVLSEQGEVPLLPAQEVNPVSGRLLWLVDQAAVRDP